MDRVHVMPEDGRALWSTRPRRIQGLRCLGLMWLMGGFVMSGVHLFAQESFLPLAKDDPMPSAGYPNWKTPTLGGQQFWTDVCFRNGWRIQKHAVTSHFRLLDADDVRHAWGDEQHCLDYLQDVADREGWAPMRGRVVLVLHGLIRTRRSMNPLCESLRRQLTDATVINFEYASTRGPVRDHAEALGKLIERLGPAVTRIDFVGHSMGNIVVRQYLFELQEHAQASAKPPFGRMVMLGPPNQGSRMATLLGRSLLFLAVTGPAGRELGRSWSQLEKTLTAPGFDFAIIAGGAENDRLIDNWLLSGPNDFTVGVQETRLPGARDFQMLPLLHSTMMKDEQVQLCVARFLEQGYLVSEEQRSPIAADSTLFSEDNHD